MPYINPIIKVKLVDTFILLSDLLNYQFAFILLKCSDNHFKIEKDESERKEKKRKEKEGI